MNWRFIKTERWTPWHIVAAVMLALLSMVIMSEPWLDIYSFAYGDEEYSHIWLVPIVFAWLVWVRRARMRFCRPTGMFLGPIMVAAGWACSLYGFYQGVQSLWHGGAVLMMMGCLVTVLGKHLLFRFMPAMFVLVFMVPVPGRFRQEIAIPLQNHTAELSRHALELFVDDVEVSGNVLKVNGREVTVAEACNGLRMVFPLILVSYAFSFGMPLRNSVRLLILLASPAAAILCNVVRILPSAWLYGSTSAQIRSYADTFHDASGWAMLPLAFGVLYLIIAVMRWAMIPVERYPLATQT